MELLYHASAYKQDELKPGFQHSGKEVKWDKTESNIWLYATTLREEAISMGFASAVEKKYDVTRYKTTGNDIHFECNGETLTLDKVAQVKVYLYTLRFDKRDGWVKVNNKYNGMDQEYKTQHLIRANLMSCEEINLREWMDTKHITFALEGHKEPARPNWAKWAI